MSDIRVLLGKRIRELRKKKKLTQDVLAEKIGIESRNLLNIENGKSYPRPETLSKLADALEAKPSDLFVFEHHQPVDILKEEILNALDQDDELVKTIYKITSILK